MSETLDVKSPQAVVDNTASKSILAARRALQKSGMSPRSTIVVHGNPPSGRRVKVKPTAAASHTVMPVSVDGKYKIGAIVDDLPPVTTSSPATSRAASPSVTRTAAMLSSCDANSTVSSESDVSCEAVEHHNFGVAAYRRVHLSKNGTDMVLAVSELGDRLAIYFPKDKPLDNWVDPKLPTDVVHENYVQTIEEAELYGADMIGVSAGISAAAINVKATGTIFGVLAATASPGNANANRYFALLCEEENGESNDVFVFAQTREAEDEFTRGRPAALFPRAYAVVPVVHVDVIESGGKDVLFEIHKACGVISHAHVVSSLMRMQARVDAVYGRIKSQISRMRDLVPECETAKIKKCAALTQHCHGNVSTETARELSELSSVSSCIEEMVAAAWSETEIALAEVEKTIAKTAANVYVAARINFAPYPGERGAGFARAARWGFPQVLDTIDFSVNIKDALAFAIGVPGATPASSDAFQQALTARS